MPSNDTIRAKNLAVESKIRLAEAEKLANETTVITNRLERKIENNGWSDIITQTMMRKERP